jgi:RHS repeat-associated protein
LQTDKNTERKLLWDEENRLEAIDDNGFVSNYWYDAAGERTVKTSGDAEQMYVNGLFSGGNTETAKFTAYVNPYLVVSKGGNYTKHIYIGSQRIVSKLGDLDSYGADPRRIEYAGANVDGANVKYAEKYVSLQQTIKDRYAAFEVEYYGKDNNDYVNGAGFCCDENIQNAPARAPSSNDNPELFQYYYHSDHLGSTSLITDLDGNVVQHIEYVPFGEVFIEERNNKWNTPYLFNAKELDEETGLYYYGSRYYDPRVVRWLSLDPPLIDGSYFDGKINGGVYNSFNLNGYIYCYQNPVILADTEGSSPTVVTAAVGAVAGGIIGGGIEMFSQWRKNGKITNWRAVAGSAAGGAVTGGMAGLTLGASVAATTVGVGLASAAGGITDDMVQGKQSTIESVATNFIIGAVTGGAGTKIVQGVNKGLQYLQKIIPNSTSKTSWAKITGILQDAVKGKGNFGLGSSSYDDAMLAGKAWVGDGFKMSSDGKAMISSDGLRQFRMPSTKPKLGKTQANFEWRNEANGQWQGNGHLDINK